MQPDASTHHRPSSHKDLSPAGQALFLWLRQFARALKVSRLYRESNPIVEQAREASAVALDAMLETFGNMTMRFAAQEIRLEGEVIVRPFVPAPGVDPPPPNPEDYLPFFFYRDGIRALELMRGVPRPDFNAFFDAARQVGRGALTQDDLLTLMWQANLTHIHVDAVPLEQTIYLSSRRGRRDDGFGSGFRALAFNWAPSGDEIHADIGQTKGAQGLHRDTFDDWDLPLEPMDPIKAYRELAPEVEIAKSFLMANWAEERDRPWTDDAPALLRHILEIDPAEDTRAITARSAMTWVVNAVHRTSWAEASRALAILKEIDPELKFVRDEMASLFENLPLEDIAENIDEAEDGDMAAFSALIVGIGPPAINLGITVMSLCNRARPRAAAAAALTYAAADDPLLLAGAVNDPRWYVVRNAVFILGQIGGPDVVDLLLVASRHAEPRVRRQVVQSLGNAPLERRLPLLLNQIDTRDPQLLSATLNMLARDRSPRALKVLLERFASPNFEYAAEWVHRAYVNTLQDWVDDKTVPLLESLVMRGGWMAAPSPVRDASARMLQRLGTENAMAALEIGLRSRYEVIRSTCLRAMSSKEAA